MYIDSTSAEIKTQNIVVYITLYQGKIAEIYAHKNNLPYCFIWKYKTSSVT